MTVARHSGITPSLCSAKLTRYYFERRGWFDRINHWEIAAADLINLALFPRGRGGAFSRITELKEQRFELQRLTWKVRETLSTKVL